MSRSCKHGSNLRQSQAGAIAVPGMEKKKGGALQNDDDGGNDS